MLRDDIELLRQHCDDSLRVSNNINILLTFIIVPKFYRLLYIVPLLPIFYWHCIDTLN